MPAKPRRQREESTAPSTIVTPTPVTPPYKYLRALVRTRVSNTLLRIAVCAVWNGFSSVLTYSSQTSMKNSRIPSSFFPSCSSTNFILPGVTNADTVHSLNLSIALKYLNHSTLSIIGHSAKHTSRSVSSSHLR